MNPRPPKPRRAVHRRRATYAIYAIALYVLWSAVVPVLHAETEAWQARTELQTAVPGLPHVHGPTTCLLCVHHPVPTLARGIVLEHPPLADSPVVRPVDAPLVPREPTARNGVRAPPVL